MRFLDTMSMHIACYGFTSEQRAIVLNDTPDNSLQQPANKKFKFVRTSAPVSFYFFWLNF